MANKYRGEIDAEIGGRRRTLVLTLGALAELESAFAADDLPALAERFGSGRLSARDLTRVIAAGLRGAGEAVSDDEVAGMTTAGSASGYVRIAAALIAATFEDSRRGDAGTIVKSFPWAEAMRFGFGVLRLSPDAFWGMTPRELAAAIIAVRGQAPVTIARADFDALMTRFPDRPKETIHG